MAIELKLEVIKSMHGGWIDWSVNEQSTTVYNQSVPRLFDFIDDADISSDPTRVCVCFNNTPNCSVTEHSIDISVWQSHKH